MPWLTLLLAIPVLGALLIAALPGTDEPRIRTIALATSGSTALMTLLIAMQFDTHHRGLQFQEHFPWQLQLFDHYVLGVDGFSMPLILLAGLLNFVAILVSHQIPQRIKGYTIAMLSLESAMLGVLVAQDWSLFYIFWELTLIPLYILINSWGGKRRGWAAMNFMLYTMGGSVFLLIALLSAADAAGNHSFLMTTMAAGLQSASPTTQLVIFLGMMIGFGVKMPLFPLHGWLPLAHVEAPSPVSILLSGILLKMGSYGLLRTAAMLPAAMVTLQGTLATLGMINIIYGGLLAWRQTNLKAMVAYSSISHMGVVVVGIAALTPMGTTGAMSQMVAHGLVAGSLFLLAGLLYHRTHILEISHYGGLIHQTPRFALFTTLAFLGSVGVPGTAGFVAELHVLIAGFQRWGVVGALPSLGMLITAAYGLAAISRIFAAPPAPGLPRVADLQSGERVAAWLLAVGTIGLGLLPHPLLALVAESVNHYHTPPPGGAP